MKNFLKSLLSNVLKVFWIFPLNNHKIVFRSSQGEKYNCNPKYITEYIETYNRDEFQLVWLFNNPANYEYLKEKGITVCKTNTLASLYHLCTARFLIDNHGVQSYLPIRNSQITINTWHGGGSYKRGRKNKTEHQIQYLKKMATNTGFYISSCKKYSENNLADIFRARPDTILPFGTARNDLFFKDFSALVGKIREHYHLSMDSGLILFAPTFRRMGVDTETDIDINRVVLACEKRFGKKFYFAYRLHEFVEHNNSNLKSIHNIISVNDYEDMQELIAASDVIITDYSSVIWDAAIAEKPCFIYATDLEKYREDRDFYTPIEKWPFALAQNNEELENNILKHNTEVYNLKIEEHLFDMGSYETGCCAKRVVEFMQKKIQEETV